MEKRSGSVFRDDFFLLFRERERERTTFILHLLHPHGLLVGGAGRLHTVATSPPSLLCWQGPKGAPVCRRPPARPPRRRGAKAGGGGGYWQHRNRPLQSSTYSRASRTRHRHSTHFQSDIFPQTNCISDGTCLFFLDKTFISGTVQVTLRGLLAHLHRRSQQVSRNALRCLRLIL